MLAAAHSSTHVYIANLLQSNIQHQQQLLQHTDAGIPIVTIGENGKPLQYDTINLAPKTADAASADQFRPLTIQ